MATAPALFNFCKKGGPQGLTILQLASTTGVVDIIQLLFTLGGNKVEIYRNSF
jgi:hypothetical protein